MKYRESGMPSEQMWDTFFNPIEILNKMDINKQIKTIIDVGCGYGTFLFPIAELVSTRAIGIDIDNEMIESCRNKIKEQNTSKIELINGDISNKDALKELIKYNGDIDYITLFNILHCEEPIKLLKNVYDILNKDGKVGVIHWNHEETPRGPSMEIRPKPEMIIEWASKAGFVLKKQIELPPHHFGLVFIKQKKRG